MSAFEVLSSGDSPIVFLASGTLCNIPLHGHATACLSVPNGGIFDLYPVWGDSEQCHYKYLWTGFTEYCLPFILVKSLGMGILGGVVGV